MRNCLRFLVLCVRAPAVRHPTRVCGGRAGHPSQQALAADADAPAWGRRQAAGRDGDGRGGRGPGLHVLEHRSHAPAGRQDDGLGKRRRPAPCAPDAAAPPASTDGARARRRRTTGTGCWRSRTGSKPSTGGLERLGRRAEQRAARPLRCATTCRGCRPRLRCNSRSEKARCGDSVAGPSHADRDASMCAVVHCGLCCAAGALGSRGQRASGMHRATAGRQRPRLYSFDKSLTIPWRALAHASAVGVRYCDHAERLRGCSHVYYYFHFFNHFNQHKKS